MPVSASFPLLPEPSAATPSAAAGAELEGPARGTGNEFLGFGLLRPFRRDLKADFAADGGERLVRSAVGQILGTMAGSDFTQGELPWRTDYPERVVMPQADTSAAYDCKLPVVRVESVPPWARCMEQLRDAFVFAFGTTRGAPVTLA